MEDEVTVDDEDSATVLEDSTVGAVRTDVEAEAGGVEVGDTETVMALAATCETA